MQICGKLKKNDMILNLDDMLIEFHFACFIVIFTFTTIE